MCGIAGIIGEYNLLDKNKILEASKHRGPDAIGFF